MATIWDNPGVAVQKEIPAPNGAGLILYIVERCGPNNRKDDSNEKEDKSSYKDITVAMLFDFTKLTGAVIDILLMPGSAHRDKGKHNISQDVADADQSTLAADIHQTRIKGHQNTRYEEGIRQDLDIHRKAVSKKAFGPDHKECDNQLNTNANSIIS